MIRLLKTKLIYVLAILSLFVFCMDGWAAKIKSSSKKIKEPVSFVPSALLPLEENIINYSRLYLGSPYRRGSKGPNGFDCSGFTHFVFSRFDYKLGASSMIQATEGERLAEDEIQTGDLIFFKGRNSKSKRVGHVGIVISKEEDGSIKFIHSACGSGVCISNSNEPYYKARYVGCNRILKKEEPERERIYLQYIYPTFPSYSPPLHSPPKSVKKELFFIR